MSLEEIEELIGRILVVGCAVAYVIRFVVILVDNLPSNLD